MEKAILYITLAVAGMVGSLFSPLIGAITCIEAYLMNPKALAVDDWGFRYQFWTTLAFLAGLLIHNRGRLPRVAWEGAVLKSSWLFVGVCALSATWALERPDLSLEFAWERTKTLIAATALLWVIRSKGDFSVLTTAFGVGVAHAGLLHTFGARLGYIPPFLDRENGVLPEDQPTIMVMFLPLMVVLAMYGSRMQRVIACCAMPFVLNSIVKSYQRAAFVGLMVAVALLVLFLRGRARIRLAALLAVAGCLFVVRLAPSNYWDWIRSIEHPQEEGSAASRFVVGHASLRMLLDHPFGVGYKNYKFVSPRYLDEAYLSEGHRSAHNSFFAVACDLGPLGFVPWILAIATALVFLRRVRRSQEAGDQMLPMCAMALEIGLYSWCVMGLFHEVHDVDPAYWFLALSIPLYRLHRLDAPAGIEATSETASIPDLVRTL